MGNVFFCRYSVGCEGKNRAKSVLAKWSVLGNNLHGYRRGGKEGGMVLFSLLFASNVSWGLVFMTAGKGWMVWTSLGQMGFGV